MPQILTMAQLNRRIVACEKCPRLRQHCRSIARQKRAAFREWTYHGKPVPNLGGDDARLLLVGLAPAAHGANRTGRMFTGDRCGDFLYRAMHEAGFANQPTSISRDDGLQLIDAVITAAAHCAPPANKPTADELANCAPYLEQTFDLLKNLRVVVCLGKIGLDNVLRFYKRRHLIEKLAPYKFAHAAEYELAPPTTILCSYHPSQQNTFTGRLTHDMLLAIFRRAAQLVER